MSANETIQLMIAFGMFTIALIKLIVELLKKTTTNNRSQTLASLAVICR